MKLYTFPCGEVCRAAEALLNRRGVPYATIAVDTPEGSEQLMKATGELQAPVLQIGDKQFAKGYSEARWTAMLDEAGYPKAPANRRAAPTAVLTGDTGARRGRALAGGQRPRELPQAVIIARRGATDYPKQLSERAHERNRAAFAHGARRGS